MKNVKDNSFYAMWHKIGFAQQQSDSQRAGDLKKMRKL